MSKLIKILLASTFLLASLAACANVESTTVAQPTNTVQGETLPTQADQSTLSASNPTAAAPAPVQPPAAAPADPQAGASEGQSLLDERCTVCHTLDRVTAEIGMNADWEAIVTRMIAGGADLTDEEKAILVQFLAENYK